MITSTDITRQVRTAVEAGDPEGIDVDAVVRDIIATFGLVNIDTIPEGQFWGIVAEHDATQA